MPYICPINLYRMLTRRDFENLQESGHCKGVRLASGQDIFSQKLLVDPSFVVSVPVAPSQLDCLPESPQVINQEDAKQKVVRGVCILKNSLKPDVTNFVFVYPPRCKINVLFYVHYCLKKENFTMIIFLSSFVP